MDIYFGIRTTSESIHLGHFIYILDLYKYIISNNCDNIYFLLAQIHALINNNIDINTIKLYSSNIANQVIRLFMTFDIFTNNSTFNNNINILYQFDYSKYLYELLFLISTKLNHNFLVKNPIFKLSNNKTTGLLLYPILQAIDVFLFSKQNKKICVCVSNDQKANINMLFDIKNKFKLNYDIDCHYNSNVLYDVKRENKMSKSLNNTISLNFDDIKYYVMRYITHTHNKHENGNPDKCPFFIDLFKPIISNLNIVELFTLDSQCRNGTLLCKNCKLLCLDYMNKLITIFNNTTEDYNKYISNFTNTKTIDLVEHNYKYIINKVI